MESLAFPCVMLYTQDHWDDIHNRKVCLDLGHRVTRMSILAQCFQQASRALGQLGEMVLLHRHGCGLWQQKYFQRVVGILRGNDESTFQGCSRRMRDGS